MDNQGACQSPFADSFARFRTPPSWSGRRAQAQEMADLRAFRSLARLVLIVRHREQPHSGSKTMDKFESFAFAFGFVATAFITMVALPLA
jgi:hypothetical protein